MIVVDDDGAKFYRAAWNTIFAPWWKLWLARLFGKRFQGKDGICTTYGYFWRGKYYITDCKYHDSRASSDRRFHQGGK